MGTGYTRQSAASIVTSEVINAAPLNDEFNAIKDAFDGSTGHSHDGTIGEGPQINLTNAVSGALPIANGGTGGTSGATALTNLDAGVGSIAGLTTAADKMIYTTASDTYATTDLTSFARTLLDDADAATARATLGSVIGTNVQAYDAGLQSISGLTTTANQMIYLTASDTYAVTSFAEFSRNLLASTSAGQFRTEISAKADTYGPPGHIHGLHMSNSAVDATNDITVLPGYCTSSNTQVNITLSSTITKQLDGTWAVGTNQGGLDTGSIANTTYHVYVIRRSDTGVVDVIFSTSASSPTLPTGYTDYRRIGSIIRSGGVIRPFYQLGDRFLYKTEITDRNDTTGGVFTLTMSVPTGSNVFPIFRVSQRHGTAGQIVTFLSDGVAGAISRPVVTTTLADDFDIVPIDGFFQTNTSAQLALDVSVSSGTLSTHTVQTQGYIDRRGKDQ